MLTDFTDSDMSLTESFIKEPVVCYVCSAGAEPTCMNPPMNKSADERSLVSIPLTANDQAAMSELFIILVTVSNRMSVMRYCCSYVGRPSWDGDDDAPMLTVWFAVVRVASGHRTETKGRYLSFGMAPRRGQDTTKGECRFVVALVQLIGSVCSAGPKVSTRTSGLPGLA